jgi:hypothetical protein
MAMKEDKEFLEFRNLMATPTVFEDGVNMRTVIMALFVGFLMTPTQMYMQLVAGIEMGSAAQWVTAILYIEIARRALTKMKRPEIFVLFYMCGAVIHSGGGLLWQQFLVQSQEMQKLGITEYIPAWFAPGDPAVLATRSFFIGPWMLPLLLMTLMLFITRLDHFGLGYIMFRLTSDVEKLPFPMAPVGAMGMTALADASNDRDTWRWKAFSIGAMAGIAFGFVYLAIPNITGAILSKPIKLLPLPFVDITNYTEKFLPTMPFMISFDLTFLITGMVMPFWAMVGSFIGLVFSVIANPALHAAGVLHSWQQGIGGIQTIQANTMDFYFSFGLGLSFAVAAIGIIHIVSSVRAGKGQGSLDWSKFWKPVEGRGDIPLWVALLIYLFSTGIYIGVTYWLVNVVTPPVNGMKFPMWILLFYGFVYTPFISYIHARMEGAVGQHVSVPFVREATFILSGYQGAAIWFAPIPMHDYARQTQFFRTTELTGTKFTSLIKAEILIFPVMLVGGLLFSQFIWQIDNVPSKMFPYANEFWELRAYNAGLIYSSTLPGESANPFREAFKPEFLGAGLGLGIGVYAILSYFGLPIFLVYGVVKGLDQTLPHAILPMFLGALIGRYICRKRFGENWSQYRIVFAAGFSAGIGLITMLSMGFVFMSKSVVKFLF